MSRFHLAIAAEFTLAEKLVEALEESYLEIEGISAVELEPFGEEQSLRWGNKAVAQIPLDKVDWSAFSHVLLAGNMTQAATLAAAVKAGCVVLDLYGMSSLIGNVPVVVPGVNDDAVAQVREQNIIALANPQISQLALALKPLLDQPISRIFVSSLLPSAYFGDEQIHKLAGQTAQLLNGIPLDETTPRVAFDVVPAHVQPDEKSQPFSKAFVLQLAKILPNLAACTTFHSLQVPVFYGVSQMVSVQSEYPLETETLRTAWQSQEWVNFHAERVVTPVQNGEEETANALQLSQLLSMDTHTVQFWSVADEQKFSLSFLAVELLKRVVTYQNE